MAYLQKHMIAKHKIYQPVIQVKCDFCGCTFADQDQFEPHSEEASRHLANHTGAVAQLIQDQLEFFAHPQKDCSRGVAGEGRQEQEASGKINSIVL